MNKNGLTISIIMKAESANYGEGIGNLTELKKMSRGDNKQYTYISRQALRYSIVEQLGWNNTPVTAESKVVQFSPDATIEKYPEIDLFGYMRTTAKTDDAKGDAITRAAVVRLSNAISLEAYNSDMDFLTNMGLAKRGNYENAIAQSEIHSSYYAYTVTIDLDKVGIDKTIEISNKEKAKRVNDFLDTLAYLYRDIKGRRENLAPLFVIGGLYERKCPYFENNVKVLNNKVTIETIKEIMETEDVKNNTVVGVLNGIFNNDKEISAELAAVSIKSCFNKLKEEVSKHYEQSN
ncbi:MAG: type I-B CRISPR-associated protein Cas7/Cst2/DevR [Clostridia bacterium]